MFVRSGTASPRARRPRDRVSADDISVFAVDGRSARPDARAAHTARGRRRDCRPPPRDRGPPSQRAPDRRRTTTTDAITIVDAKGRPSAGTIRTGCGGENGHTGAVRTPVEAIVSEVPYGAGTAGVSAEGSPYPGTFTFGAAGLNPQAYTVRPGRRPATPEFCGEVLPGSSARIDS